MRSFLLNVGLFNDEVIVLVEQEEDTLIWAHATNDQLTVKKAYHVYRKKVVQKKLWLKVWHRYILLRISMFI